MTISEIAKMAGVSSAAVSRYLNDGSLSAEKRDRIRKVIEETHYRPQETARALRTRKSRRIGVLVPQIDSESVPRVLDGISRVADERNYTMLLMNSDLNREKELRLLESFLTTQVDGIIFDASVITPQHEAVMKRLRVPVVILGQQSADYPCVFHDDFGAAHDIMTRVLERGRKHPAYIGVDPEDAAAGARRAAGVRAALDEWNAASGDGLSLVEVTADFTMRDGYLAAEQILRGHPETDCMVCGTDVIAVGVLGCLRDRGVSVPDLVGVTGIGHGRIADITTPRLTTVHYHYETSGEEAANMLFELIRGGEPAERKKMLGYRLVGQESA